MTVVNGPCQNIFDESEERACEQNRLLAENTFLLID